MQIFENIGEKPFTAAEKECQFPVEYQSQCRGDKSEKQRNRIGLRDVDVCGFDTSPAEMYRGYDRYADTEHESYTGCQHEERCDDIDCRKCIASYETAHEYAIGDCHRCGKQHADYCRDKHLSE